MIGGDITQGIARESLFDDLRSRAQLILGADRDRPADLPLPDVANEVDVAIDRLIEFSPQRRRLDAAGDRFAKGRIRRPLGGRVKPLLVIVPCKGDDIIRLDSKRRRLSLSADGGVFIGSSRNVYVTLLRRG